jgi:hypothetical protein
MHRTWLSRTRSLPNYCGTRGSYTTIHRHRRGTERCCQLSTADGPQSTAQWLHEATDCFQVELVPGIEFLKFTLLVFEYGNGIRAESIIGCTGSNSLDGIFDDRDRPLYCVIGGDGIAVAGHAVHGDVFLKISLPRHCGGT